MNGSRMVIWVFVKDIFLTYLKLCKLTYRICSNNLWGKYECGEIL